MASGPNHFLMENVYFIKFYLVFKKMVVLSVNMYVECVDFDIFSTIFVFIFNLQIYLNTFRADFKKIYILVYLYNIYIFFHIFILSHFYLFFILIFKCIYRYSFCLLFYFTC